MIAPAMMNLLGQAQEHPGHVKVALTYTTAKPNTDASQMMVKLLKAKPPYVSEVLVLLPAANVYNLLEAYEDVLESLRLNKIVPSDAKLLSYKLHFTNTTTSAHILG